MISGKVKLSAKNTSKILEPNDIVSYSKTNRSFSDFKDVSNNSYRWEDGNLIFDNSALKTVLRDISDWYNLDLKISPELNLNTNITLTIREESVYEIMEILKMVVPIDYKIKDNKVEIYSRN